jgi:hypothetical protein
VVSSPSLMAFPSEQHKSCSSSYLSPRPSKTCCAAHSALSGVTEHIIVWSPFKTFGGLDWGPKSISQM